MAWDQIRGHDAARDHLLAAFRRGRLAHAYLFAGPDGVGKRRFALELAKALLCEQQPNVFEGCDRCPACVQVSAGTNPDCFAARREPEKNVLSVDVIREFCHRLGLKSAHGRKVGIVEDADDFNESSANAFLKPLEEPPPGTTLILLATSVDKQLPTILSRCQLVPFRPLAAADVSALLADHGVEDPATRARLVKLSGGSPGRALALNDESLWAFRETLLAGITADRPDVVGLPEKWTAFAEEVKDGAARRERATLVLHLFVDLLRAALRKAVENDQHDPDRLTAFGRRIGPDRLADWLEACLAAEVQLARYVQIALVLETLFDRLR